MTKRAKDCAVCGNPFQKDGRLSRKQWTSQKYCSIDCRSAGDSQSKNAARAPLDMLFNESYQLDKSTGCWNWTGAISSQGYGTIKWRGSLYRAHMLSMELAGNPRPNGLIACHHCDNRRCVNPRHIYWGTQADNVRDAQNRGRLHTGQSHHSSKLTAEAVRIIRASGETHTALAETFGVTRQAIRAVRIGTTWSDIL